MTSLLRATRCTRAAVAVAVVAGLWAGSAAADLKSYVQREDPSFAFNLANSQKVDGATLHHIKLTSQTWQGLTWEHWLTVIQPDATAYPNTALLFITGGSNKDGQPNFEGGRDKMVLDLAIQSKSVVAVLRQVPNQPLFDGKVEDEIIAYTFDQFLKGQGDDWPLLLPMVKSAVKAMDAIQQFGQTQLKQDIKSFVVTGASKRGWTTWLTGATDPRVVAIAPMVIDVLNMKEQMKRQLMSYGKYSEEIADYSERGIQSQQGTAKGEELNKLVDPYAYRDSLTMPKLLLLGTNDPYWTVDAANLYVKDLKGPTYVHYEPNAGHGLGPGAYPALLAFYQAILKGKLLPEYTIEQRPSGAFRITHQGSPQINVWAARSVTRDFRKAKWESYPIGEAQRLVSNLGFSEMGYAAYFVELVYTNDEGVTYTLSGPMKVTPEDVFPYDENGTKIVRSEPKGEPEGNPYAPKVDEQIRTGQEAVGK